MSDAGKRKEKERREEARNEEARNVVLPPTLALNRQMLFNREVSWLYFNNRVLEEALDRSHPLLERLKFLSIFSTNLDEFFMIRVSGLKQQIDEGVTELSFDGLTATAQLRLIADRLRPMVADQMQCLRQEILPELSTHGILITPYRALSDRERRSLNAYFLENVFPVLTPQAVDPSHPFPYISNLSLNLGVMIEPSDEMTSSAAGASGPRFARVKVPPIVPRLVPVGDSGTEFTLLEELIAANISVLFPGMRVGEFHLFRVTRDADIEIREDEANDLLRVMEQELRKRRFGTAVRLEVASTMPQEMVRYLESSLGLSSDDTYTIEGPLNVPDLMAIYKQDKPEMKDKPLLASLPAPFRMGEPLFDIIKRHDILVHHPYNSFSTVIDFISTAAIDPDVLAIKMTLYRTGQDSPIVRALMEASERGKQVAVLVELKARFDEEKNIEWARQLERAGVHVVYGLLGLKTHCKLALVVRREADTLRRYVHIGTGNYNPTTARIYTDLGLFTSNPQIGADATELFNYLTGFSRQTEYRRLIVAPVNMRDRLLGFIEREMEHYKAGRSARIIAKINSLTDTKIIRKLYEASQTGVPIDLIVRGVCSLRPGVPGMSDTIDVISIVGRFLEHSRILYFANGGEEDIYIGSADWMLRNIDRRVELLAPIEDARLKKHLKEEVLDLCLRDNVKARRLLLNGNYQRVPCPDGNERIDSQSRFMNLYSAMQD
ncbi:MAG TPA: polyphosphate kinase 1 [Blastocatellia bacterium]|nr:polyphosphate kinase 1 [Blastocatellia bacterium]